MARPVLSSLEHFLSSQFHLSPIRTSIYVFFHEITQKHFFFFGITPVLDDRVEVCGGYLELLPFRQSICMRTKFNPLCVVHSSGAQPLLQYHFEPMTLAYACGI